MPSRIHDSRGNPKEIREEVGITDELIRFSVGIEDAEDLKADVEQAILASKKGA